MKIKDRITNYNVCDANTFYSSPQQVGLTYSKFNIYNASIRYPLQKYWFYLKCVKIIEKSQSIIKFVVADKNFINFIDNIDKKIHEILTNNNLNYKFKKSYTTQKSFPEIFTCEYSNVQVFGNKITSKDEIKTMILNEEDTVSLLIELSDILINDTEYWINYRVKQMKILCGENECIFDKLDDYDDNPIQQTSQLLQPPPPPTFNSINPFNPFNTINKQSKSNDQFNQIQQIQQIQQVPQIPSRLNLVTVDVLNQQLKKINEKRNKRINTEMQTVLDKISKDIIVHTEMKKKLDEDFNQLPISLH